MKLNWGWRIALLYGGFVVLIITMVCLAMNQKVDLVTSDYYEQELKYQEKIDKTKRTLELSESLTWNLSTDGLFLKFPKQFKNQVVKGTVYFFRPSDESMDTRVKFVVNDTSGTVVVPTNKLRPGVYKMQIDWDGKNESYFNEGTLKIR